MAAVASNHVSENFRGSNADQYSDSGPSFTAVNGTSSPSTAKPKSNHDTTKASTEETNSRPTRSNGHQDRPKSPTQPRTGQIHSQPEQHPSPTQSSSADPSAPSSTTSAAQRQSNADETRVSYVSSHSRTPSSPQHKLATTSPQKRKRSYSDDYASNNNVNGDKNHPTYHSHGLPPSPERQKMYGSESSRPHEQEAVGTPTYPPPPEHPPDLYQRSDRSRMGRNDFEYRGDPSIAPAPPRPYYSDARMAEALQRENRNYDPMGPRDNFASPENDEEQHAQQYGDHATNRTSQSGLDMERKRRKRVFSNRTKTGCMTCRRRKKKCDEQHPECNNCIRGGFVCEGYTIRNTWQKPVGIKPPIPLQSKHGYPVPIQQAPPYQQRYASEVSPEYPGPPPPGPSYQTASDGDRGKPIIVDEDRDMYSKSSPPSAHSKTAWTKSTRPYPNNPPHLSKYYAEGDSRSGSVHEGPYETQDQTSMHPPTSIQRAGSSHSQYSGPSSQQVSSNSAQVVAQTALQHSSSLRPSPLRRNDQLTEREKMLKGNYYHPFTPALIEDRERCIAAIWRFNNATNPAHGASIEERARLFRAIINLRPTPEPVTPGNGSDGAPSIPPPMSMPMPFGSVGERVVVEAPFHCDYGYNITIGDDVLIGADCRISDTCAVTIGARCIFSPNVKLVCATYPIDPRRRKGSGGQALGRNIVIEEDCWIGSNVTILAGVRVGRSSTVGAGSLLHQDVPRFTVVAGNPAKVSRGIYDGQTEGQ